MAYLEFDGRIVSPSDVVGVEEKTVMLEIRKEIKNPDPAPTKGFFAKLFYSDTVIIQEKKQFAVVVLKVKGGLQVNKETGHANQLFDFYAVCGNKDFFNLIKSASNKKDVELEIGNFYSYFETLRYPDYVKTNVLFDRDIMSKADFMAKYMK